MKKFLTILLCVLAALLLIGCSYFDSAPVKPKILGVEHIVQDQGLTYVQIDSTRYSVTEVWSGEIAQREGRITIKPVDGMLVTVAEFTGEDNGLRGMQFLLGEWNEEQIEAYFLRNYAFMIFALSGIFLCVLGMGICGVLADKEHVQKYSST